MFSVEDRSMRPPDSNHGDHPLARRPVAANTRTRAHPHTRNTQTTLLSVPKRVDIRAISTISFFIGTNVTLINGENRFNLANRYQLLPYYLFETPT